MHCSFGRLPDVVSITVLHVEQTLAQSQGLRHGKIADMLLRCSGAAGVETDCTVHWTSEARAIWLCVAFADAYADSLSDRAAMPDLTIALAR